MNESMKILFGGYLGITDGKISYIAKTPPKDQPATIIDGTGMVLIPGLVNCHTQLAATALRSYTDDLTAKEALEARLLKEDKMDSRCAKAAATLGIAECLRFGITSVSDLYYYPAATAEAVAESGIKANLALSAYRYEHPSEDFDFETDPQCQALSALVETWNGYDNGRIRTDAGIHAEYNSNYPLWESLAAYACENGLGMQLHLAQTPSETDSCLERTGLTPAQLLDCHRLFRVPTTAAGCNCLTREDQLLLGKRKVSAVATPLADAKAGKPCMPVIDCVKSGMNVALGTGAAIDCGNLDLFEVMRGVSMAARACAADPAALPAQAALMMATVCGAKAQGRADSCGMIKLGMDADLALVDFSAPHLMPCHNVLSALVFCAKGGDVAMTMVRGKILYQNGRFPTIDLTATVQELSQYVLPKLFGE